MVGMTLASLVTIYAPVAIAGENYGNALVLGGGGPVGEAWESGVIAGLADKGIYLSRMDRIIGTSAGAVVGARLAMGMKPEQLTQQTLTRFEGPPPSPTQKLPPPPDLSFLVSQLEELNAGKTTEQSVGIEVGRWALSAHSVATESEFVASYWRRFPKKQWPSGAYECVSVNAATDLSGCGMNPLAFRSHSRSRRVARCPVCLRPWRSMVSHTWTEALDRQLMLTSRAAAKQRSS